MTYVDILDNLRVSDQNGVSLLCIMLEIHHSGWEPLNYHGDFTGKSHLHSSQLSLHKVTLHPLGAP